MKSKRFKFISCLKEEISPYWKKPNRKGLFCWLCKAHHLNRTLRQWNGSYFSWRVFSVSEPSTRAKDWCIQGQEAFRPWQTYLEVVFFKNRMMKGHDMELYFAPSSSSLYRKFHCISHLSKSSSRSFNLGFQAFSFVFFASSLQGAPVPSVAAHSFIILNSINSQNIIRKCFFPN